MPNSLNLELHSGLLCTFIIMTSLHIAHMGVVVFGDRNFIVFPDVSEVSFCWWSINVGQYLDLLFALPSHVL